MRYWKVRLWVRVQGADNHQIAAPFRFRVPSRCKLRIKMAHRKISGGRCKSLWVRSWCQSLFSFNEGQNNWLVFSFRGVMNGSWCYFLYFCSGFATESVLINNQIRVSWHSLKEQYARFKRWQREPMRYVQGEVEHRCNNCGFTFRGHYCPTCSQRASLGRIGWHSVRQSVMDM